MVVVVGGGGGLRGPDDRTQFCQSETSYTMMPNFVNFSFYPEDMF